MRDQDARLSGAAAVFAELLATAGDDLEGNADDRDPLAGLAALPDLRRRLDAAEHQLIASSRRRGLAWSRIAAALGLGSPQAAEQRYARLAASGLGLPSRRDVAAYRRVRRAGTAHQPPAATAGGLQRGVDESANAGHASRKATEQTAAASSQRTVGKSAGATPTPSTGPEPKEVQRTVDKPPAGQPPPEPQAGRSTSVQPPRQRPVDGDVDLRRAADYVSTGTWLVLVGGERVGSVRPTYRAGRKPRWTAWTAHATPADDGEAHPTRQAAAVQVLAAWQQSQDAAQPRQRRGRRA
jgi:hypothetical protein